MPGIVLSVSYKVLHLKIQQTYDAGSVFSSHFIEENIASVELVMTSLRSHSRCYGQDSNLSVLLPETALLAMMQHWTHRSGSPP